MPVVILQQTFDIHSPHPRVQWCCLASTQGVQCISLTVNLSALTPRACQALAEAVLEEAALEAQQALRSAKIGHYMMCITTQQGLADPALHQQLLQVLPPPPSTTNSPP